MFNVLWLDDEWERFAPFRQIAKAKGFDLFPFAVRQDGLRELRANHDKYDAVLLDAQMQENTYNEETSTKGMKDVINAAHEFHIPIFVSTGQDYLKNSPIFRDGTDNLFIKGDGNSELGGDDELFEAMLNQLEQSESAFVRRLYSNVFVAIERLGISDNVSQYLISILSALHFPDKHSDLNPMQQFNSLRQVIESAFIVFHQYGILPEMFRTENKGMNLTFSSLYLCGKEVIIDGVHFKHKGSVLPLKPWGSQFSFCLTHLQNLSHPSECNMLDPKYMLFSDTLLICEFLLWADIYIRQHSDVEANRAEWQQPAQQND